MSKVSCCCVSQKADIYKIHPTVQEVHEEIILYLKQCCKCENPVIEIRRIDILGQILEPVRLKVKNIQKFLSSMVVIWKPKSISFKSETGKKNPYYFNRYGQKQKGYTSFSNLRLGMYDPDPF
ncbi:MAG: hypothetical protein US20_C0005G0031 [Candidatus Pacebacteria bacterium GW2011_GWF1_36_5]|nr:MAG: hypothetical protein US20_C0005G0031 [Candidatus Pacebacteria bacterium GW2011_GWF1_36_5]